ncbi:uncharacterized protein [Diabrotica undecimpunctata]|uniref:uncharacterized protein n=1 Tax=Diabrotica undecimpunctata TaxID=50387 RepID=UPI003B632414
MKYIYFLFIYFLVALATAEETLSLEGRLPKCECREIIDQILCKLTGNSEKVLTVQTRLAKIVKETNEVQEETLENSAKVKEIVATTKILQQQVNVTVTVVNSNTADINQIQVQIDNILEEDQELEQTLIGNSCKLNQIKRILIGLGNCQCRQPDSDEGTTSNY